MTTRRSLAILLTSLVVATACAPGTATPAVAPAAGAPTVAAATAVPKPAPAPAKVTIGQVGGLSDAAIYLADAKGNFREQGITLEEVQQYMIAKGSMPAAIDLKAVVDPSFAADAVKLLGGAYR